MRKTLQNLAKIFSFRFCPRLRVKHKHAKSSHACRVSLSRQEIFEYDFGARGLSKLPRKFGNFNISRIYKPGGGLVKKTSSLAGRLGVRPGRVRPLGSISCDLTLTLVFQSLWELGMPGTRLVEPGAKWRMPGEPLRLG